MSWRHGHGSGDGSGRGYHHGNLREALIDAALELIAVHGPTGFSFAEMARAAGVSPAAPYRHFKDRAAVVAEIARRGFALFAAELAAAWRDGTPDPLTAILACGRAYLGFAGANPAHYAAMFEGAPPPDGNTELAEAGALAFAVLRRAAEKLCAGPVSGHRPPALMVALHIWSLAHGIASLFLGRGAGGPMLPSSPEDLLEAGVRVYLQGLGLAAGSERAIHG